MTYPFGQAFTLWFYPLVDDKPVELSAAMQAQTPAIHIYESMPTREDAAVGAGSPVHTITDWEWDAEKSGFSFTVPAIDDPSPGSTGPVPPYWAAINFRLDADEQVQTVLRAIDLERVTGHTKNVDVTPSDLQAVYSPFYSYTTEAQRLDYIAHAIFQVRMRLKSTGFSWAQIHRPDDLKLAVIYRALANFFLYRVQNGDDKFAALYREHKEFYTNTVDSFPVTVDLDGDGAADGKTQSTGMWLMGR